MRINDFNGDGKWSRDAILQRYSEYCKELGIPEMDLSPAEHEGTTWGRGPGAGEPWVLGPQPTRWVYPVMTKVIDGIKLGDEACKMIGIEFIEEDQRFTFGILLKSKTARMLRQTTLSEEQKARVRKRVIEMLLAGHVWREFREYAKLLKKIGVGEYRDELEAGVDRDNPYVMRFYRYLLDLPSVPLPPDAR